MKRIKLFTFAILALALTCQTSSYAENNSTRGKKKTTEELLIGSWCRKSVSDDKNVDYKLDLYWHFNDDKTEQMISIFTSGTLLGNEVTPTVNCGTWKIEGDVIKTVNLSGKEKNVSEWKILKLDNDSLQIEFYDKQPKRFVESFKRINK